MRRRRICFVSGTRAEFGLMVSTLRAIEREPALKLQIVVTGMHLDRSRGRTVDEIRLQGWKIDRLVPWSAKMSTPAATSKAMGMATARLAKAFDQLKSEIVLVVGDRVEAFAAAAAAHVSGRVVAHVHGGDRAIGQIDDSLRHAITKLSHLHFPATRKSAARIAKLGEDRCRIHCVGTPGLDDLGVEARRFPRAGPYALIVLHPVDAKSRIEFTRARQVLSAVTSIPFEKIVVVHPNNDPGADGIVRCWNHHAKGNRFEIHRNLPRDRFLRLMRDAAVMVGNSSSGIIEAASFGTPVVDVGPRQLGRERSQNVVNVPYSEGAIRAALSRIWNYGRPRRFEGRNIYGGGGAGARIARLLSTTRLDAPFRRKLIAY